MLTIRFQRVGRKHEPIFRLVLTDSKNGPKSGKFLEILGNYDARRGEQAVFKADAIKHWVSKGAQLSDTAHNILIDKKIIDGKKINKLPKKTATKKEAPDTVTEKAKEEPKEEEKAEIPTEPVTEPEGTEEKTA